MAGKKEADSVQSLAMTKDYLLAVKMVGTMVVMTAKTKESQTAVGWVEKLALNLVVSWGRMMVVKKE